MAQRELPLQIQRAERVARGYLARCLSMEVRRQIKWTPTSFAYDIWMRLKDKYDICSDIQLAEIFRKWYQVKLKPGERPSDFIKRFTNLVNKLTGTEYEMGKKKADKYGNADRHFKGNFESKGQSKRDYANRQIQKKNQYKNFGGKPSTKVELLLVQPMKSEENMKDREGPRVFVLDSGATKHLHYRRSDFTDYQEADDMVTWGDGSITQILGYGTIIARSGDQILKVQHTAHVSNVYKSLISLSVLQRKGFEFSAEGRDKITVTKDGKHIFTGTSNETGLYVLTFEVIPPGMHEATPKVSQALLTSAPRVTRQVLHSRFMHPGRDIMTTIFKNNRESKGNKTNKQCLSCLKGKVKHSPFPKRINSATRVLQKIHSDLMGPPLPTSWMEKKYIVTFTD
eukprot:Ihof_evm11s93 gene=Ihof_evmTU11s93